MHVAVNWNDDVVVCSHAIRLMAGVDDDDDFKSLRVRKFDKNEHLEK